MSIFVFGKSGMLGSYVYSYFKDAGFDVIGFTRADLNLLDVTYNNVKYLLVSNNITKNDVVINCAGLIKQRKNVDDYAFIKVNAVFPHILSRVCADEECQLLTVTTDCVYSGLGGGYNEYSDADATDIYGLTKSMGEPVGASVLRTSIIGEELNNFSSLLEWVKSNKDKTINGYINHRWNGITCLQFAKVCRLIIENNLYWRGVRHVTSPYPVSKYELVKLISEAYDLNIYVIPFEAETRCDRSLTSIFKQPPIPSLKEQLVELKEFKNTLAVHNEDSKA